MKKQFIFLILFSAVTVNLACVAQSNIDAPKHQFYFCWGYNTEWYTRSNIKITQPYLQNDYMFENIQGHDHRGWDNQLFQKPISIPQYNYRLGYIFNKKKGLGLELNFDHTKFIATDGQQAHLKGILRGASVDTVITFSESNGFFYFLNNGANFLLLNLVKKYHLYTLTNSKIKIEGLLKAGVGPVIPHVSNKFFGNENTAHFQFGGWNAGAEAALRIVFLNYVYIDYSNKVDYARYSNLKIYEGNAKHAFGTYEMVLSLGLNFPAGKRMQ